MNNKNSLLINMSSFGQQETGLGVYSRKCSECLERSFSTNVLASFYKTLNNSIEIYSPKQVAIKHNSYSALLRLLYSYSGVFRSGQNIYNPTHSGFFFVKNQILTIHDLICFHYPHQHKFQYLYFKYFLPFLINSSKAVYTVSNSTKSELIDAYSSNLIGKKIYVIPNGVDLDVFIPTDSYNISKSKNSIYPYRFLLVVGASFFHKNIHEILENHYLWSNTCRLKIVGSSGDYKSFLIKYAEQLGISNLIDFLGYTELPDLVNLYRYCEALIYPSLCEGFGIPPLEAMACGAPVIVSDLSVHKEVLSSIPLYITPSNKESWKKAFNILFNDRNQVESKILHGFEHVKSFTWESSCNKLISSILETFPELNQYIYT